MSRKKKFELIIFVIIFCVGLSILTFPFLARLQYRQEAKKVIRVFEREKKKLSKQKIDERLKLAQAFNASLVKNDLKDPYTDEEKKDGKSSYAKMLEINEFLGHVSIPKINEFIPLYAGTSKDVLFKGVGHLEGTSLPIGTRSSHTVIAGHSGYPKAKLFNELHKLEIGDIFYIHNIFEVLAYQVDQIKIVEPTEYDELLIKEGMDYATLLTCTPIAVDTHRLLVRGKRLHFDKKDEPRLLETKQITLVKQDNLMEFLFYIFILISLILLLLALNFYLSRRRRKKEKLHE